MLSFYFTSLSFKPPLKTPHKLYIRVELPDGSAKTTETSTYNFETNIAVFSEAFDFLVSDMANTSYFHLQIYEYNQSAPVKSTVIGKTTLYVTSKFFSEGNKITLTTTQQSDVTLFFVIDASNQLKEKLLLQNSNDQPQFKSPRDPTKEDRLVYSTGQLDFLKLGPLFYEFVLALSPLVLITEKIYNFFTWVNPNQTLLYSAGFMLIYFYYRGLAIISLLVFFRYSSLVIASVIKAKPLQETAENKLQIYKRNLLFIQHGMELTVRTNEYYKKVFHDYDKTAIMQIFAVLKKFSLVLAVLLMIYNMNHLVILIYWSFLFYNTSYGHTLFTLTYKRAEKIIDLINNTIVTVFKIENAWKKDIIPIKETTLQTEYTTSGDSFSTKSVSNHKTFVTYENQRWWLGRGWCDQMLLGERPAWSDLQGNIELKKENFTLPGFKWRWDGNWEVQVTSQTDQEGWEYATDFLKNFHSKAQSFDYVRRRRWMRRCIEEIIEN